MIHSFLAIEAILDECFDAESPTETCTIHVQELTLQSSRHYSCLDSFAGFLSVEVIFQFLAILLCIGAASINEHMLSKIGFALLRV